MPAFCAMQNNGQSLMLLLPYFNVNKTPLNAKSSEKTVLLRSI
jgi:hypothetical protein